MTELEQQLTDDKFLLEKELQQAAHTVRFLHDCLTNPEHCSYGYPDLTLTHLKEWRDMLPSEKSCGHSITKFDCPSCQQRVTDFKRRKEIEMRRSVHKG